MWTVDNVVWLMARQRIRDALAFFHEQNDFQPEAFGTFEYIRKKWGGQVGPMSMTFAGKDKFVPLQAADALAYEANKRLRDVTRPLRKSIDAMDPSGERLIVHGFTKQNMTQFMERLDVVRAEVKTFGHPVRFFRDGRES